MKVFVTCKISNVTSYKTWFCKFLKGLFLFHLLCFLYSFVVDVFCVLIFTETDDLIDNNQSFCKTQDLGNNRTVKKFLTL